MTISIAYVIRDQPGNTVTGEWEPGRPASEFLRTDVFKTTMGFRAFVEGVRNAGGFFRKELSGSQQWVPLHRVQSIDEELPV